MHQYMGTFFPQCFPIFIVMCFWLDSGNGKKLICHFICTSLNTNFSKKFISYSYFFSYSLPIFPCSLEYVLCSLSKMSCQCETQYLVCYSQPMNINLKTEESGKVFYFMLRMLKFCSKVVQMFSPDGWNFSFLFFFITTNIYIFCHWEWTNYLLFNFA